MSENFMYVVVREDEDEKRDVAAFFYSDTIEIDPITRALDWIEENRTARDIAWNIHYRVEPRPSPIEN